MSEHDDDQKLRDAVHRAYDGIPTPVGMHGRVTAGLREGGRSRPQLRGWATGLAVAAVLAGVVGAATVQRHLGGSQPAPIAAVPGSQPTPTPAVSASPVGSPTATGTAIATARPTAHPTPRPTPTPLPSLPAGPGWQQQWAGTSQDLNAVDFVDKLHGWVAGAAGTILVTSDGGAHWAPQRSGVTVDLSSVSFVDRLHGWAVGASDTVLTTSNGGSTWTLRHTGTGGNLDEVDFVDASHGWAVVGDAPFGRTALATSDGGVRWAPVDRLQAVQAVHFADALHGWATNGPSMMSTSDGGSTWSTVATGGAWFGITSADSAHAYAVSGSSPYMTSSADGGATWTSHQISGLGNLFGIAALGAGRVWVAGTTIGPGDAPELPAFATSADGGATWAVVSLGTPAAQTPLSVSAFDLSDVWVVGKGGLIVKLTGATGGAQ